MLGLSYRTTLKRSFDKDSELSLSKHLSKGVNYEKSDVYMNMSFSSEYFLQYAHDSRFNAL